MHVVIVGAGTFGASLAWWLARSGDEVTLVDQFEPGDPRASSGGESRLLRSAHGPHADYTASARRARTLWRELEAESGEDLYLECGLTWFAQRDDAWEAQSIPVLAAQGIPYQRLAPDDGALLFPSWDPSGLRFLLHEPEAGVVRAQRAVQTLVRRAAAHGATVLRERATPAGAGARLEDGRCSRATSSSGPAARGSPSSSPSTCPCAPCSPSSSSSTAARPGATRRSPPSSISTPRSTARTTSTGSA